MSSQEEANIALSHHWLSRRCHPNDHARRQEMFERLMNGEYDRQLEDIDEALREPT